MSKSQLIYAVSDRLIYWRPFYVPATMYCNVKNLRGHRPLQKRYDKIMPHWRKYKKKRYYYIFILWVFWKFKVVLPLTNVAFKYIPNRLFTQ